MNHRPQKKVLKRYMQEKLAVTVVVIMLALLALSGVLYHIVDTNNEDYTRVVLTQRSNYDSRTIPYRRGDIVDRNGTYLATSDKVYNVIIDATQIYAKEERYLNPTVDALVQCFGYDRAELMETLNSQKTSPYIRYERRVSHEKKEAFETLKQQINDANSRTDKDDPHHDERVYGVWFEEEYKRIYPYNSLACNVIGFASGDGTTGSGGIEQYYNDMLIGNNGREYGYLNDESNKEIVIKPARNGYKVVSTIDVNVQTMVENYPENDNHGRLWLTGSQGDRIESGNIQFIAEKEGRRVDYVEFVFPSTPEALTAYRLHGEFWTSGLLTKGNWSVTFPLEEID